MINLKKIALTGAMVGTLALGAAGCGGVNVNNSNESGVVIDKEQDAYIVQLDNGSFRRLYGPLTDTSAYQIGKVLNASEMDNITQGKITQMEGGQ